jgi:hypothetical protein
VSRWWVANETVIAERLIRVVNMADPNVPGITLQMSPNICKVN